MAKRWRSGKRSVKDIQAHLRHSKANTTANEYMQELPESVGRLAAEVIACQGTPTSIDVPSKKAATCE